MLLTCYLLLMVVYYLQFFSFPLYLYSVLVIQPLFFSATQFFFLFFSLSIII